MSRRSTPTPPTAGAGANAPCDSSTQSCPGTPPRQFRTLEWAERDTWCSENVTLRGTTRGYVDNETETANVRTASDSALEGPQILTVSGNAFTKQFQILNVLPRRVGADYETSRELDAIAAGVTTPRLLRMRFIPTLTSTPCRIGRSHFDMAVVNYEVQLGGTINYVPGWIQYMIQLGSHVPAGTGGNIGLNWPVAPGSFGGSDWRYCKKDVATGALTYWDGAAWQPVPATWSDPSNILLYGMAIWNEGSTAKTQFPTMAWPEAIPNWGAPETSNATTVLATWTTNINATWTNKFDLKRRECRSTVPACCRYKTKCVVSFVKVATNSAHGIVLAANNGRSNAGVWSLGDTRTGMPPHEFGHHLGNPDEYAGGVGIATSVNTDGATAGIDANSIMGANLTVVKARHYDTIALHLAAIVRTQFSKTYTYQAVPVV